MCVFSQMFFASFEIVISLQFTWSSSFVDLTDKVMSYKFLCYCSTFQEKMICNLITVILLRIPILFQLHSLQSTLGLMWSIDFVSLFIYFFPATYCSSYQACHQVFPCYCNTWVILFVSESAIGYYGLHAIVWSAYPSMLVLLYVTFDAAKPVSRK